MRRSLADAEREAAVEARLPAILRGDDHPADAKECVTLAKVCYRTKDYAASARFYAQAFEAGESLGAAGPSRYDAARSAALAGADWSDRALAWLGADLDLWRQKAKASPRTVAATMRRWQAEPDFASVRDGEGLREEWRRLWADVAALLQEAEAGSR